MRATRGNGRVRARAGVLGTVLAVGLLVGCTPLVDVHYIAGDPSGGRNNATAGSERARAWIAGHLRHMGAEPVGPGFPALTSYDQPITLGTNVIGIIPGTDLADEYVVVGAHYDHVATCQVKDPSDTICNGATDNAAGVAAALEIGRRLTVEGATPRRSVVLAFWDREEDGLLGSAHYRQHPVVPLEDTVAYVNFDILGANLLPSLRDSSFAIGAESGGARLQEIVADAAAPRWVDTSLFSAIFGQNRSDYAVFIGAGVPSVFLSDSTGRCYHTTGDDPELVDYEKLDEQIATAEAITSELANTDDPPVFAAGTPLGTWGDLVVLDAVVDSAAGDLGLFSAADQATIQGIQATIDGLVAAGEAAFGDDDVVTMLGAAANAVSLLTHGACESFIPAVT